MRDEGCDVMYSDEKKERIGLGLLVRAVGERDEMKLSQRASERARERERQRRSFVLCCARDCSAAREKGTDVGGLVVRQRLL